ncbi:MAG: hypothetical protein OHK0036_18150 [Bacteroidia bacterium]
MTLGGVDNTNNKVSTVSGNLPYCLVDTCNDPLYAPSSKKKSCQAIACSKDNSSGYGVITDLTDANILSGTLAQNNCKIESCFNNKIPSETGDSCVPQTRQCLPADYISNGINVSDPAILTFNNGTVSGSDVSNCLIATCDASKSTLSVDQKSCQPILCDATNSFGVNGISDLTGALTYSGDLVQQNCLITSCNSGYDLAVDQKSCTALAPIDSSFTMKHSHLGPWGGNYLEPIWSYTYLTFNEVINSGNPDDYSLSFEFSSDGIVWNNYCLDETFSPTTPVYDANYSAFKCNYYYSDLLLNSLSGNFQLKATLTKISTGQQSSSIITSNFDKNRVPFIDKDIYQIGTETVIYDKIKLLQSNGDASLGLNSNLVHYVHKNGTAPQLSLKVNGNVTGTNNFVEQRLEILKYVGGSTYDGNWIKLSNIGSNSSPTPSYVIKQNNSSYRYYFNPSVNDAGLNDFDFKFNDTSGAHADGWYSFVLRITDVDGYEGSTLQTMPFFVGTLGPVDFNLPQSFDNTSPNVLKFIDNAGGDIFYSYLEIPKSSFGVPAGTTLQSVMLSFGRDEILNTSCFMDDNDLVNQNYKIFIQYNSLSPAPEISCFRWDATGAGGSSNQLFINVTNPDQIHQLYFIANYTNGTVTDSDWSSFVFKTQYTCDNVLTPNSISGNYIDGCTCDSGYSWNQSNFSCEQQLAQLSNYDYQLKGVNGITGSDSGTTPRTTYGNGRFFFINPDDGTLKTWLYTGSNFTTLDLVSETTELIEPVKIIETAPTYSIAVVDNSENDRVYRITNSNLAITELPSINFKIKDVIGVSGSLSGTSVSSQHFAFLDENNFVYMMIDGSNISRLKYYDGSNTKDVDIKFIKIAKGGRAGSRSSFCGIAGNNNNANDGRVFCWQNAGVVGTINYFNVVTYDENNLFGLTNPAPTTPLNNVIDITSIYVESGTNSYTYYSAITSNGDVYSFKDSAAFNSYQGMAIRVAIANPATSINDALTGATKLMNFSSKQSCAFRSNNSIYCWTAHGVATYFARPAYLNDSPINSYGDYISESGVFMEGAIQNATYYKILLDNGKLKRFFNTGLGSNGIRDYTTDGTNLLDNIEDASITNSTTGYVCAVKNMLDGTGRIFCGNLNGGFPYFNDVDTVTGDDNTDFIFNIPVNSGLSITSPSSTNNYVADLANFPISGECPETTNNNINFRIQGTPVPLASLAIQPVCDGNTWSTTLDLTGFFLTQLTETLEAYTLDGASNEILDSISLFTCDVGQSYEIGSNSCQFPDSIAILSPTDGTTVQYPTLAVNVTGSCSDNGVVVTDGVNSVACSSNTFSLNITPSWNGDSYVISLTHGTASDSITINKCGTGLVYNNGTCTAFNYTNVISLHTKTPSNYYMFNHQLLNFTETDISTTNQYCSLNQGPGSANRENCIANGCIYNPNNGACTNLLYASASSHYFVDTDGNPLSVNNYNPDYNNIYVKWACQNKGIHCSSSYLEVTNFSTQYIEPTAITNIEGVCSSNGDSISLGFQIAGNYSPVTCVNNQFIFNNVDLSPLFVGTSTSGIIGLTMSSNNFTGTQILTRCSNGYHKGAGDYCDIGNSVYLDTPVKLDVVETTFDISGTCTNFGESLTVTNTDWNNGNNQTTIGSGTCISGRFQITTNQPVDYTLNNQALVSLTGFTGQFYHKSSPTTYHQGNSVLNMWTIQNPSLSSVETNDSSLSPTLSWTGVSTLSRVGSSLSNYEIALTDDTNFENIVSWTNIGSVLSYQFTGLNLQENITYYIKLRAKSDLGRYSAVVIQNFIFKSNIVSPNLNFGTNGELSLNTLYSVSGETSRIYADQRIFNNSAGKFLVESFKSIPSNVYYMVVSKINQNGVLDNSFNQIVVNTNFTTPGTLLKIYDIESDQNNIYILTREIDGNLVRMVGLRKYDLLGNIVSSFGNNGLLNISSLVVPSYASFEKSTWRTATYPLRIPTPLGLFTPTEVQLDEVNNVIYIPIFTISSSGTSVVHKVIKLNSNTGSLDSGFNLTKSSYVSNVGYFKFLRINNPNYPYLMIINDNGSPIGYDGIYYYNTSGLSQGSQIFQIIPFNTAQGETIDFVDTYINENTIYALAKFYNPSGNINELRLYSLYIDSVGSSTSINQSFGINGYIKIADISTMYNDFYKINKLGSNLYVSFRDHTSLPTSDYYFYKIPLDGSSVTSILNQPITYTHNILHYPFDAFNVDSYNKILLFSNEENAIYFMMEDTIIKLD